jgi:hypothetical protein
MTLRWLISAFEEGNGYDAAMVNFRFLASATWTTDEAVKLIRAK